VSGQPPPDAADVKAAELVAGALTALRAGSPWMPEGEARALPAVRAITTGPDDVRRRCIVHAARIPAGPQWRASWRLLDVIARKRAGLTLADVEALLPAVRSLAADPRPMSGPAPLGALAGQIEATWPALDEAGRQRLGPQLAQLAGQAGDARVAARLRRLAGPGGEVPYDLISDDDEVGKAARLIIAASAEPAESRAALVSLLSAFPASGRAGRKWLSDARSVLGRLADPAALAGALLAAAIDAGDYEAGHGSARYVARGNEGALCGLACLAGLAATAGGAAGAELLPALRQLALKSITITGGSWGAPRSIRLASACVQAITDAALPSSVTELLRVERGTRHGTLLRQARTSIDALAAAQGMGREELLERAVEEHGLSAAGTRRVALADGWTAVLSAGGRAAEAGYLDPGGAPRKSPPPPVRQASAQALAAVRNDVKAMRATIGNERSRLDGLLAAGRRWDAGPWRELYLDHPVTGRLARELIWTFTVQDGASITGIPVGEATLMTCDGGTAAIPGQAGVRLWHPVGAGEGEVAAWRRLLLDRQVTQPVKQAFREVYVLTPAERAARDYSSRLAGHVFRQEPARALMKGRGWAARPLAARGDGPGRGAGRREYGHAGVRAEFLFDPASHDDVTGSSLYAYVTSGQVRFSRLATDAPLPLPQVPPLVFSEAMRDVDLFIGVTSVGADPQWHDRGEGRPFGDYWHRFAFGDLGAGAQVRRAVLERLVPALAIAGRCTLEARWLVVRGDLRTYKIHLGSGSVLMSPDDQYLCVAAARDDQAGRVFLPFDDDRVLSMIISRAFLLAADAAITDSSITARIARR
jgi:hypothetical protein